MSKLRRAIPILIGLSLGSLIGGLIKPERLISSVWLTVITLVVLIIIFLIEEYKN